jgi:hypothetical protein
MEFVFWLKRYEIEKLCQLFNYKLFRTSVKNNSNIDQGKSYRIQNAHQLIQSDLDNPDIGEKENDLANL